MPPGACESRCAARCLWGASKFEGLAHRVLRRKAQHHRRPFAETKDLIAGYTLIRVQSREEALELTKRFPNPAVYAKEGEIEVRPLFELEDFGPARQRKPAFSKYG